MNSDIQPLRGFEPHFGASASRREKCLEKLKVQARSFGYKPVEVPLVEARTVFERAVGASSDIVQKEMFSVSGGAGNDSQPMVLRPEATASVMRSRVQHSDWPTDRMYYSGPMFRYERPQKGRLRQFIQFGIECLRPDVGDDIEVLMLGQQMLQGTGVALQINSLGSQECRAKYREALVAYFSERKEQLSEDSQKRLSLNPLRILDSKNEGDIRLLGDAPLMENYLSDEEKARFQRVVESLDSLGIPYEINSRLVRGLDYYNGLVFEWTTDQLGAQSAVAAGGRYDRLSCQFGEEMVPAVGFAVGIERLVALQESRGQEDAEDKRWLRVVLMPNRGENLATQWLRAVDELRAQGWIVEWEDATRSFKAQMRRAGKDGVPFLLVLGDDEIRSGNAKVKAVDGQLEVRHDTLSSVLISVGGV